jgi:hypothetical protein
MTGYQESYEKMTLSSDNFLLANATITATLPLFSTYFTVIQSTVAQIQAVQVQQETDKSGNTVVKNQYRVALIAQTIDVGRRVVAYAINVNNNILLAQVDYTESDLKKSSDVNLVSIAQVIHDSANANVAALATYGVTAAILTTMQTAITNFSGAIPKGRVGTTDGEQSTQQLATLFNTLKTNWAKIDKLVAMVQTAQPNFYQEYLNVRKVISTGNGSFALQASATEINSGEPISKATFTFAPSNGLLKSAATNGKDNIVKKTAAKGKFNIKSMPEGTYTVTITKPGYKDQVVTINVVSGELAKLDVILEKA